MSLALPQRMRVGGIRPPPEFADAAEMYARRTDRHGTLKFIPPPVNCWIVEFTLKPTDPRMKAWQTGQLDSEPKEVIYLWRPSTPRERAKDPLVQFVGYKLDELGVTGMIQLLERTDTTTGRGEYDSLGSAMKDQMDKQVEGQQKIADEAKENAHDRAMDKRRSVLGIPYLGVGIDLKDSHKTVPTTAPEE